MSKSWDVVVLTQSSYINPIDPPSYVQNVVLEDHLVVEGLRRQGLRVHRTSWDDPDMDWSDVSYVMFRTIWDYFHRFEEFKVWFDATSKQCKALNPWDTVRWNWHKFYLRDLQEKGVRIPETLFIEKGDERSLSEITGSASWEEGVLKPAVSGAGRHTYRLSRGADQALESTYKELITQEDMLWQKFEPSIMDRGEAALMFINGHYTHAVLKQAKKGEFRVQDDFGGTLHHYEPTKGEIDFAENAMAQCSTIPMLGRVDIFWDSGGSVMLGELELIEPEMWFRRNESAADLLGETVRKMCF